MRYLIYFIGIALAAIIFIQARGAYEHRVSLIASNKAISEEVASLNKSVTRLNGFQTLQSQTLLNSYENFLNNIYLITNANQASFLVKSKDVMADKDMKLTVKESPYSGVNEVDLEITVGNLINFNKLSAVFDAFSVLENNTSIIIKGFYQEKDYIIFNISILGV